MRASSRTVRVSLAALGLVPLALLGVDAALGRLGAEPVEEILHRTGGWALRMLLLALAVTPLRRRLGLAWLAPHRRSFGLLAFLYASLHFLTYLVFDLGLEAGALVEDVAERPFISVGFASLVLMTPLALTSTRGWMRRLGRRWTSLHRLVHPVAIGALVHFTWSVKADLREPLAHAAVAALLLGERVLWRLQPPGRRAAAGGSGCKAPEAMRR